ncbi:MAG: glutamate synthase subunit beta, partial [Cyclobacteriaceae bacterium]
QLNKAGHNVTVFERAEQIGGLLRYGIPDFKLEKWTIDRRIKIMEDEGITFKTKANVGENISIESLNDNFDSLLLCGGSTIPRDLPLPGREFSGIHFAMDFLTQQNKRIADVPFLEKDLWASDKNIIVIGGGDTGSDCVGTSNRHGAKSVTQIELLTKPPTGRMDQNPWPEWPMTLRTSSSHEEGCERDWSVLTKEFIGDENGKLTGLKIVEIVWKAKGFEEVEGTEKILPCDMVLIAAGFLYPQKDGMIDQLNLELDNRGNVKTDNYKTSNPSVFAAGDMRRGQSLVVWAISEGREAARALDISLMGHSELPSKQKSFYSLS